MIHCGLLPFVALDSEIHPKLPMTTIVRRCKSNCSKSWMCFLCVCVFARHVLGCFHNFPHHCLIDATVLWLWGYSLSLVPGTESRDCGAHPERGSRQELGPRTFIKIWEKLWWVVMSWNVKLCQISSANLMTRWMIWPWPCLTTNYVWWSILKRQPFDTGSWRWWQRREHVTLEYFGIGSLCDCL